MKTLILISALTLSSAAFSMQQCPVEFPSENYLENVGKIIAESDSCYSASEVANDCALGAGGDVYIAGQAIIRCEKDMPKMSKADALMYTTLNDKCSEKYSTMEGSMYRSMESFCHLQVTRLFLSLLTREE